LDLIKTSIVAQNSGAALREKRPPGCPQVSSPATQTKQRHTVALAHRAGTNLAPKLYGIATAPSAHPTQVDARMPLPGIVNATVWKAAAVSGAAAVLLGELPMVAPLARARGLLIQALSCSRARDLQ
jgi:hypothetical protein